ncbi:hypothetical protein KIW84_076162 [Lathyrus oleraceus]|uniref:BHLH domain-containing protein n=1 Tax=Pisum sativum TaxID=3888 RepID=A0A9D4VX76_PEA|nr:hypothetical protein KIW84_076162 [Pisum sativum]
MRNMFSSLHALLPELPSKADNSAIVDATVKKIKNLKKIIEIAIATSYHSSKALVQSTPPPQQVAFRTWSYQNVVLNIYGGEAQFCICATKILGLLTMIAFVLEKYRIDVVVANITCNGNGNFYMILAHARQCLQDSISVEETYKQATKEIMMLIS